jgi:hypothetical protein
LPLRFVLASISFFYWHVSSVLGRCLGLSWVITGLYSRECHTLIMFMQEDAYLACTACALRSRLFPIWFHARFAIRSLTHWRDGLTKSVYTGSFVALYRIFLNAFPLLNTANVPFRLNLPGLTEQLPSPSQFATRNSEPDPPHDNLLVGKRTARLSFAAQAHQTWLLKRSARWHSIVAGAVAGGVAISFESLSRRKVIAQQLFVR